MPGRIEYMALLHAAGHDHPLHIFSFWMVRSGRRHAQPVAPDIGTFCARACSRMLRARALQCGAVLACRRVARTQPGTSRTRARLKESAANVKHSQSDCQLAKPSLNKM